MVSSRSGWPGRGKVAFLPPGISPTQDPLAKLRADLLDRAWLRAVGCTAREVVVPCGEVPQLLRQLDVAVLRVGEQLGALEALPKECSEVTRASARLLDDTLVVTLSLVVVRSHDVLGGAEGVRPVADPRVDGGFGVDAAQCVLEFRAELEGFPGSVEWSSAAVREIVGRAEAAAVGRALQCGARGTLQEACGVAARAMLGAPPA